MATKIIFLFIFFIINFQAKSNEMIRLLDKESDFVEFKIIDKITSRLTTEKIKIKTYTNIKDFEFFVDKCILDSRKGFLETSALVQIKDIKNKSKDRVFLFNNWMFASNSSVNEIEHPNYDIWLKSCS